MGTWVEVNEASFLRVLEFRNTQIKKPSLPFEASLANEIPRHQVIAPMSTAVSFEHRHPPNPSIKRTARGGSASFVCVGWSAALCVVTSRRSAVAVH
jgi:hypothetical protein